jgi:hypothetical protein
MFDTVTRAEMRAHISERIDALAGVIGEESGRNERLLREELRAEIDALRAEIAELRKQIADDDATVIDLPPLRMLGGNRG